MYAAYMTTPSTASAFHDRLNLAVGETSYRQLGEITDTHPETVRRYMQGQAPSAAFMTNLCQNLGISGQWLLSGQGPMKVRDIRTHALKNADANELMGAIANTLNLLIKRLDNLEQMIDVKPNTSTTTEFKPEYKPNLKSTSDTIRSFNDQSDGQQLGTNSKVSANDQTNQTEQLEIPPPQITHIIAQQSSDDAA